MNSMMSNSSATVNILKSLAEHPEIYVKTAEVAIEGGKMAFESISESKKIRHEVDMKDLDIYAEMLKDPSLSFEEKKEILEKKDQRIERIYEKDSEDKEQEWHAIEFIAGTFFGGPIFLAGYFGLKRYQKNSQ